MWGRFVDKTGGKKSRATVHLRDHRMKVKISSQNLSNAYNITHVGLQESPNWILLKVRFSLEPVPKLDLISRCMVEYALVST